MARTLQQIVAELGSVYDPTIKSLRTQQAAIPQDVADQETQLKAQEQDYYDNTIFADARRRGLGFSGIPVGERARYGATQFLPALARVRSEGRQRATSLEDAILNITRDRNSQAEGIRQFEIGNDFNNAQLAEQRRQFDLSRADARRASGGGGSIGAALGALFGGQSSQQPQAPTAQSISGKVNVQGASKAQLQYAFNDVFGRVNANQSSDDLWSDYRATASSAKYGNPIDLAKLQIYRLLRPDLFKASYSWEAGNNAKPAQSTRVGSASFAPSANYGGIPSNITNFAGLIR